MFDIEDGANRGTAWARHRPKVAETTKAGENEPVSDIALRIDLVTGNAERLSEITLESVGLRERADLQRWITQHPELVGDDLLLLTSEFDQWEIGKRRVEDRLDVLFLTTDGSLLVAELKRDHAADTTDLQALKYAAYCSQLTVDDVVELYSRTREVDDDTARDRVTEHAPTLADGELGPVSIRLVAGSFGPAVTSVVLWLRDHGIDVGCIEITARSDGHGAAVVTRRQLIPLPEAEDYLVRRRRREQEEDARRTRQRRSETSVAMLNRLGVLAPGDPLTLNLDQFTRAWRPLIDALVEADPDTLYAEWTGDNRRALKWRRDGETYSPTALVSAILAEVGITPRTIPGPDYWLLPSGRSMYEESKLLAESGP